MLASLTGSVLGNLLLVAGLSFFIGGTKYKRQKFNVFDARHNAGLFIFAVIVAFVIPEVFTQNMNETRTMSLSVGISVILILLYLAALFFKLVTHRGVYQQTEKGIALEDMKRKSRNGVRKRQLVFYLVLHLPLLMYQKILSIPLVKSVKHSDGQNYLSGSLLWQLLVTRRSMLQPS